MVPNTGTKTNKNTYTRINEPGEAAYAGGFTKVMYSVLNKLLTKQLLSAHIASFWNKFLNNDNFYALYIVIQYKGGEYKSLGKISKVVGTDLERYLKVQLSHLALKDNQYFITEVVAIHLCFKIIDPKMLTDKESIIHEPRDKYIATASKIFGYDLPNNMNLFTWGNVVRHDGSNIVIEFIKNGADFIYLVEMSHNSNTVLIKNDFYDDDILLEFTDTSNNGSLTNFTRKVKNFEYIYKDSKIVLTMRSRK
uniref:DNA polymerase type B n=1 Tax=Phanerochaete carnosa TaxID=231932 RepID=A0A895KTC0_9APHY|nr:DNA polymerase type B [Phanerochaete carnosa]QRZ60390.1 DNA polymerase type B [Phanerochaete carnosa]